MWFFSLLWVVFRCFFACLARWDRVSGVLYDLSSSKTLFRYIEYIDYTEIVWTIQCSLLRFFLVCLFVLSKSCVYIRVNISPQLRQESFILTNASWIMRFSDLALGNRHSAGPMWAPITHYIFIPALNLSFNLDVLFTCILWPKCSWLVKNDPLQISGTLCIHLILLFF